jgi:hypothetical protein
MVSAAGTFQQWDLDDNQALQFELRAAASVAGPIRKAVAALTAALVALGARYADQDGQIPLDRRAQIRAALDAALAALAFDLAVQTARAIAGASALAVRQETALLRGLGIDARGLTVSLADPVLADGGASTNRVLQAAIGDAQRFASGDPFATTQDLQAAIAKAGAIAPRVEANVRFLTNRAINETTRQLAAEATALRPPPAAPPPRVTIGEPRTITPPGDGANLTGEPPLSSNGRSPLIDNGLRVVWVAERDACLVCLALSGHVSDPNQGIGFDEDATFGPHRPTPVWPPGMPLMAPPRHPNCRCRLRIISADNVLVPEALRREAERSVARGWSGYDSKRARLHAADRLISRANRLPRSVQDRAAKDVARGTFSDRHKPRSPLRAG